jgi:peptidoglycan/LPS O-acetylase OafA/YrhL
MSDGLHPFMSGMITAGYLIASLFFLRFWRRSREQLFLLLAAAFVLLAINQAALTLAQIPREEEKSWLYLLRLAAFSLIAGAILRKNLQGRSGK